RGALTQYALHDRLHVQATKEHAVRALLNAWRNERTEKPSETLILAGTNSDVDELNRRVQAMRSHDFDKVFAHKDRLFFEEDRVAFGATVRRLGVLNGDFG